MDKKLITTTCSAEEVLFQDRMNGLSSEEQRLLILRKAKEFVWEHFDNKIDRKDRKNRNFHYIVRNDLNRDLRIQRSEINCKVRGKLIAWTLWNKTHRITGSFGELIHQLVKMANEGV